MVQKIFLQKNIGKKFYEAIFQSLLLRKQAISHTQMQLIQYYLPLKGSYIQAGHCVCVCVLTRCVKNRHCSCSTHAKCGPSTKSGHPRGPLLVLASGLDLSYLKTQELTIKLWGQPEFALAYKLYKLFLEPFYI